MSQIKQLKFGSMTLEFSKPVSRKRDAKSFVGILESTDDAVNTVRRLRDGDLKREKTRLNG